MRNDESPSFIVRGVESKTSIDNRGIDFSSYKGWVGPDAEYPKLLVVSVLDKHKNREKIKGKHWDIDGTVREVKEVKIIRDTSQIVDHNETLYERVLNTKKNELDEARAIKEEVKIANNASSKPIKLKIPGSQASGQLRLYLNVSKGRFNSLEDAPSEIIKYLSTKAIGVKFSMEKDYSDIGGPSGKYDQSIIDWELENNLFEKPTKKNRRKGTLKIHYPNGNVSKKPDWEHGREMYFTGHAMEEYLKDLFGLVKTKSHTPGMDLTGIDGKIDIKELIGKISNDDSNDLGEIGNKYEKNKLEILEYILNVFRIKMERRHWSEGSTVQKQALKEIYFELTGRRIKKETKESLTKGILEEVDEEYNEKTDFVKNGSTVTTIALIKILRGLENQ
tara:strand:+ start:1780 stop:2952 length:1173 start_codon:yes stop_codon:yes gene_type:complete